MNEDRIYQLLMQEESATINSADSDELKAYRATHPEDVQAIEQILQLSSTLAYSTDQETEASWHTFKNQLDLEVKQPTIKKLQPKRSPIRWLTVAASLIVLAGFFYFLPSKTTQFVTSADKGAFELTDGSTITANADSKIDLAKGYNQESRNLNIIGETYIEAESSDVAMKVMSNDFRIEVLGTRFNVMDFVDDDISTVTLYEGTIKLGLPNGQAIDMKAGDHLCWNKRKKEAKQSIVSDKKPAWLDGRVSFENTLLDEVFTRLERNHSITFEGKELIGDFHFNYRSEHADLDHILGEIETASGTTIEKNGKIFTISSKG